MSTDPKRLVRTIDCTPTWAEITPVWLRMARQGYAEGNDNITTNFESEMLRMAALADQWVAHCQRTAQVTEGEG